MLRLLNRGLKTTAVLAGLTFAPAVRSEVRYLVTDLGTLPGTEYSVAHCVATNGLVAGRSDDHGFFWHDGVITDVGTLGGSWSHGYGVNCTGQVVGWAHLPGNGQLHAFVWQDGLMKDLGTLGGPTSSALAVNDRRQVVGWADLPGGNDCHAFLYDSGHMTDLGTLGGRNSVAYDINTLGAVAGHSETAGGRRHAFLLADGIMTDLGTLAADGSSVGFGLNDVGQVVGCSWTHGNDARAFLWSAGVMTDLGTLGGRFTTAQAINNHEQVVGYSEVVVEYPPGHFEFEHHAFVREGGAMLDLNDLIPPHSGWRLYQAYDVNDAGQIVGMGQVGAAIHGFLLTPIPEPPTVFPLTIGMLALTRRLPGTAGRRRAWQSRGCARRGARPRGAL